MVSSFMIFFASQNLFAQAYGGANDDDALSIIQTEDNGYVVTGWTTSFGSGYEDLLVFKLNPYASLVWASTYGGAGRDLAYTIIQTSDGGYAVAGYSWSFSVGGSDCLFLKLNSDGSLDWARTYGETNLNDFLRSIIQTSDGGYAILGSAYSSVTDSYDFLLIKLNQDGSINWARTYGGTGAEEGYSIIQTTDGGYVVVGYTMSFGPGDADFLILKIDSDGSIVWAKTYGGTAHDYPRSITQAPDGGYAVAGSTKSFGAGNDDFLILKLNSDGSLVWARTYGGADYDYANSIIMTSDEGCAIAGVTSSFGAGIYDNFLIKLNSDGSLAWARTFGGWSSDDASCLIQATDGGYVVAGETWSFGAGRYDFLVFKLSSDGSYPGCVQDCSPIVHDVSPLTSVPSVVSAVSSLHTSSPSLTITTPNLGITDACQPVVVEESVSYGKEGITYSPVIGGVLFVSAEAMAIKIYSADGKLAYSGELRKGKNRINLDAGVYFWHAGQFKGKAVVR
ncbi:MAG: hypothetical protein ABIN66_08995 [candidate division WOR-3 bacterium]